MLNSSSQSSRQPVSQLTFNRYGQRSVINNVTSTNVVKTLTGKSQLMDLANQCPSSPPICQIYALNDHNSPHVNTTAESARSRLQVLARFKRTFIVVERQLQRILQQGFQHAVSRRQKSWVYRKRSGHFLHMSWRAIWEQSSQRLKFPPRKEKEATELAGRSVKVPRRWNKRRRCSEGDDRVPRSSRSASGWLSVVEGGWQIAGGGGQREECRCQSSYTPPSMCGDGCRWRQSTGRAGSAARSEKKEKKSCFRGAFSDSRKHCL